METRFDVILPLLLERSMLKVLCIRVPCFPAIYLTNPPCWLCGCCPPRSPETDGLLRVLALLAQLLRDDRR
jgi:hypothetical protein